jgi:PKD repeat protein
VLVEGEKSTDEYIELVNLSDEEADIGSWQIRRMSSTGSTSSIKVLPKDARIPGGGFYLWANSKGAYASLADTSSSSSSPGRDNAVALYTHSGDEGVLVDRLSWGKSAGFPADEEEEDGEHGPHLSNPDKGEAFVYDSKKKAFEIRTALSPTNSEGETLSETPDNESDGGDAEPDAPGPLPEGLFFSEIYPHPRKGEGEFIELGNEGPVPITLAGFRLRDASKGKGYVFPAKSVLAPGALLVIRKKDFRFALNDTKETLSLEDSFGRLVIRARWDTTHQGASLNRVSGGFRGGAPTPGTKNRLNTLPETSERVPKEGYVSLPLTFEARGKDKEGSGLRYRWDFGDGHGSRQEKTVHTYEKTGRYTVRLTTDDGQDTKIETFRLTIKKYRAPRLELSGLLVNPKGADTGREWIEIRNASSKEVNLRNFSLQTGSREDTLVNHPIRESLRISPGKSVRVTRKDASFTLPNKEGVVRLLAPEKTVIDWVRYVPPLGKSLPEDAPYLKQGGAWGFVLGTTSPSGKAPAKKTAPPEETRPSAALLSAVPRQERDAELFRNRITLRKKSLDRALQLPDPLRLVFSQRTKKLPSETTAVHPTESVNASLNRWLFRLSLRGAE